MHSGTGTGMRNTVPNIPEQEREIGANFPRNASKTLDIFKREAKSIFSTNLKASIKRKLQNIMVL